VRNCFGRLRIWLRKGKAAGPVSLIGVTGDACDKLTGEASGSETRTLRTVVWTREEAESAWNAKRTQVNLALLVSENKSSVQTCAAHCMVDGESARVVICINESVKRWILQPSEKNLKQQHQRKNREAHASLEQTGPRLLQGPEPGQSPCEDVPAKAKTSSSVQLCHAASTSSEIRCTNCYMTRTEALAQGHRPCCTEFWTVPYELIFRYL